MIVPDKQIVPDNKRFPDRQSSRQVEFSRQFQKGRGAASGAASSQSSVLESSSMLRMIIGRFIFPSRLGPPGRFLLNLSTESVHLKEHLRLSLPRVAQSYAMI